MAKLPRKQKKRKAKEQKPEVLDLTATTWSSGFFDGQLGLEPASEWRPYLQGHSDGYSLRFQPSDRHLHALREAHRLLGRKWKRRLKRMFEAWEWTGLIEYDYPVELDQFRKEYEEVVNFAWSYYWLDQFRFKDYENGQAIAPAAESEFDMDAVLPDPTVAVKNDFVSSRIQKMRRRSLTNQACVP